MGRKPREPKPEDRPVGGDPLSNCCISSSLFPTAADITATTPRSQAPQPTMTLKMVRSGAHL